MPSNINTLLSRLNPSQTATITYESGLDNTGATSAASFNTYFGSQLEIPAATIGTGATVTFSFDPGASFTAAQQASMAQSLAIWSGMANITFTYSADPSTAMLTFIKVGQTYNGAVVGAGTSESAVTKVATGTAGVQQVTKATIQIDTSGGYGDIASYTVAAGYGIDTLVHEVGHLVGLGHTGPYNGTVTSATQQNNSTDVRTWSIMSYIDSTDATAKYYASYSPTGTNFGATDSNRAPYTPMGLDVFAAQRLLGAPTSTMFAGGQTFGFNSNVKYTAIDGSQQALSMYDFTVDAFPVVTIYDYGANNTLDLSGYTTTSTVNLNDGTFSSVNGMTNDIFIEYGTQINAAIGGTGDDTFTVNSAADTINGGAGTNTVVFAAARSAYTFTMSNGTYYATMNGVTDALTNIQSVRFSDQTVAATDLACFLPGTRIATPQGEVAVEHLHVGAWVRTRSGAVRRIAWIGYGRSAITPYNRCDASPVLFQPGALGLDAAGQPVPRRPLKVTRRHGMVVGHVLVPAEHLVNGVSVQWDDSADWVEFYHIELDSHDILFAEGAATESFRDDESEQLFHNTATRPARGWEPSCLPVVDCGPELEAAWRQVAGYAGQPPRHRFTTSPDLHLRIDGTRIDGRSRDGETWRFDLPPNPREILIASDTVIPATDGISEELRRLGVAVMEMTLWRHNTGRPLDLADPALRDGWHADQNGHRWTKGLASLPVDAAPIWQNATQLELLVRPAARYPRRLA